MTEIKIPVLVCGFTRKEGLLSVVNSAINSGVNRIYCALDGPRNYAESIIQNSIVRELREISIDSKVDIYLLQRSQNLGIAAAIVSSIDWFFENEDRGIVLEDDLEIDSRFFQFAYDSLYQFENDRDTWLVSGNQFFTNLGDSLNVQWSHYPLIWGWATWRDKWLEIRKELFNPQLCSPFGIDLKVMSFLRVGKIRTNLGFVDSWAIPFCASTKTLGKYCYMPPENLVTNIGRDQFASHTTSKMWHLERELESFGRTSQLNIENRNRCADTIDKLIEQYVYQVSWKSVLSFVALKIRSIRFPQIRAEHDSLQIRVFQSRSNETVEKLS